MKDGFGGRDQVGVSLTRHPTKYLFTVVISTKQDAFIRQLNAENPQDALDRVLEQFDKTSKERINKVDKVVLIKDVRSVWAATFETKAGFALASVIKTNTDD